MQDKANPLATVLSAAMLLKYGLGEENAAKIIETAVLDTLSRGYRTGDIYSDGNVCAFCILQNFCRLVFFSLVERYTPTVLLISKILLIRKGISPSK